MTLEQLIREAARAGRLRGLTLWPRDKGWQANTTEDRTAWRVEHDADPVEALKRALSASVMSDLANDIAQQEDIFS